MPNPYTFTTVIFDLDGVVTKTAKAHAAAWKKMFDEFLKKTEQEDGCILREFSYENDYLPYVDGKPRYKGVQSFLESRQIKLPLGSPSDEPTIETICGLGNKKNIVFQEVLQKEGIEIYDSTITLIKDLKAHAIHIGVASSSKNCQYILKVAQIENHFETCVDGVVSAELGLKGKPESDIFIKAAENLGATPQESVIVEDAVSGVQAGRDGQFGLVIGLARENNDYELLENGADVVLKDFKGVLTKQIEEWFVQHNKQ
jgi:beta-phosphoglucomutase family hydrolase